MVLSELGARGVARDRIVIQLIQFIRIWRHCLTSVRTNRANFLMTT